jgi:hypothetical protein
MSTQLLTKSLRSILEERTLSPGHGRPDASSGSPRPSCFLSCIFRWIADGVQSPDGSIVRLEAVRMGGRWLTSVEALHRFAEAQTPAPSTRRPAAQPSPAARKQGAAKAGKALEKAGA